MGNKEIKRIIKKSGVYQYKIARKIGISEVKFSQWFRIELNEEQKTKILNAIKSLKGGE